jgi:hypothetical protein
MATRPPFSSEPHSSNVVASNDVFAASATQSSGPSLTCRAPSTNRITARCGIPTTRGVPVEPEVKLM